MKTSATLVSMSVTLYVNFYSLYTSEQYLYMPYCFCVHCDTSEQHPYITFFSHKSQGIVQVVYPLVDERGY